MSSRVLVLVVVAQAIVVLALALDRLVPPAHAAEPVRCEIANWPDALTSSGFASLPVRVVAVDRPVPVDVKDWSTTDVVRTAVHGWETRDRVTVEGAR